jgi:hypothetical protein
LIFEIYPEKAQYLTKEYIKIILECSEPVMDGAVAQIVVKHLQDVMEIKTIELLDQYSEIMLEGRNTEYGGYGVYLTVSRNGEILGLCHTAFDVVSDSSRAIRYGFLSDFSSEEGKDQKDINLLRKFHINMVQYYDWSYRHDQLVSRERVYRDMMGREVDLDIVKAKIRACREYGMKSLGYGAVYAASSDYYQENKEASLCTSAGEPLIFIDTFYIMNVAADSPWRRHIIEEYAKAVSEVGFDGIHMDTYGFPKTAYSYHRNKLIRLSEEYPSLIKDAKDRLGKITPDNHLIFNNVGNWPVGTVAKAPQDAIYIEVWEPYINYSHLRSIILEAKREGGDKPVILAAYLEPFRTEDMERASYAAFLLTAVIAANGAAQLLIGEENAVLTQGYYVDHSYMTIPVSNKMRSYYDFIVQYMELLYDSALADVSMTHMGWDNTEYRCLHENWSVDAEADKIWLIIREKENRKLISLINLCGNQDSRWNKGKHHPRVQEKIRLQVQIDYAVKGIFYASPDYKEGEAQEIEYQLTTTNRGYSISFDIPKLTIWSMIWIDFTEKPVFME